MDNQKKGKRGQTVHQECNRTQNSPVKSLAQQVHHILSNGGNSKTSIYTYYHKPHKACLVTKNNINKAVKDGAHAIGLFSSTSGYAESDVSSHSLRAGGALAMHLVGVSAQQIKIQGRWKSTTFENYIHTTDQ